MDCPKCNHDKTCVKDTRKYVKQGINRRRECLACRFRFTTLEVIAECIQDRSLSKYDKVRATGHFAPVKDLALSKYDDDGILIQQSPQIGGQRAKLFL